jgi:hypothetical protein
VKTIELQRKWDLSLAEVEALREAKGGYFGATTYRRTAQWRELFGAVRDHYVCVLGMAEVAATQLAITEANRLAREQTSETEHVHNIVTNQGLDHFLDIELSGGTQITAWKVAVFKTNTTPLATHTYASPGYTEIAASDVTETVRQAWTDGGVSSQSVDNSGAPATYTADTTVELFGASMVGGGTAATTIANTAGGGTLSASSLFGSSKPMTATDTIDVTYTRTAADDGV